MKIRRHRIVAATFVLAGLLAGRAAAQSYGGGDQEIVIGAASFTNDSDQTGSFGGDGYLYGSVSHSGPFLFSAMVMLPNGGEITQICLYARNTKPGISLQLDFEAVKLVPGGLAPGVVPLASVAANFTTGYDVVCSGLIAYTVHDAADVDHDGTGELIAHQLVATFVGTDSSLALGGARIVWHRQVSPKPATASFTDVPTNHPFFQFVEALVASGIAAGYGDGRYGVNDPITRGQMAVFLSAALGLHWPN